MRRSKQPSVPAWTPPKPKTSVWIDDRAESNMVLAHGLRIAVHHHRDHPPETWLLSTQPATHRQFVLQAKDLDAAKIEAIAILRQWVSAIDDALGKVAP